MPPEEADRGTRPDGDRPWTVPVFAGAPVSTSPVSAATPGDEATGTDELPFSKAGVKELKLQLDQYQTELVSESRRIARRHQADVISPAYVRHARDHLGTSPRRRTAALAGSLGWAMAGAAFPVLLKLDSSAPSASSQLIWNLIGTAGAILITVQFFRE
jgi:hypothetical protein